MRVAISGTYSAGKTTLSVALSLATGIEMIHARTMREILPVAFPGKKLEECDPGEICELIFHRLTERIIEETRNPASFISDGSSIQEWAYCMPRLMHGMNPNEKPLLAFIKKYAKYTQWLAFKETLDSYGTMVKNHVKDHYDHFIHLPIEFPLVRDGHRPVNERFRSSCDKILRNTYRELGLSVFETGGSMEERLRNMIEYLDVPLKMDIDEAIRTARIEVKDRFDSVRLEA